MSLHPKIRTQRKAIYRLRKRNEALCTQQDVSVEELDQVQTRTTNQIATMANRLAEHVNHFRTQYLHIQALLSYTKSQLIQSLDNSSRAEYEVASLRIEVNFQSISLTATRSELSRTQAHYELTIAKLQETFTEVQACLDTSRTACVDAHKALGISQTKIYAVQIQPVRANHSCDSA